MATSNTGMVASTVIIQNLIRLISSLILTRLLDAEVYGVVGIVMAVAVVFGLLSDLGFVAFLIRSDKSVDSDFLDEIWSLRLIRSIILTILVIAGSGPIAGYLDKPELQMAIAASAGIFITEGLTSLGFATAVRSGKIIKITIYDLTSGILQTIVTIILAYYLRNYWAVIGAILIGGVLRGFLSYIVFPQSGRRWKFSKSRAIELGRFSRYIVGSSVLTLILGQADKVLLARFLTLEALGFYIIASTLAQILNGFAGPYSERILYPNFSRIMREEPGEIRRQYYASRTKINFLYLLAAGGLITSAPLIIEMLYDPRYREAAIYMQLLAFSGVFSLNNQAANWVLIALNRMWITMMVNVVRIIWLVGGGALGYYYYGSLGFVAAVGSVEFSAQLYSWWALYRAGLLSIRQEAAMIGLVLVGALMGYAVNMLGMEMIGGI